MQRTPFLLIASLVACAPTRDDSAPTSERAGVPSAPGTIVASLDAAPRTIPYGGYVDFDGEPVNASGVAFNFVLFPCATPGSGAGGCDALWVASGAWTNGATWTAGWPTGAPGVSLPIFSGRFTVELGGAGQNPLPDAIFHEDNEVLYLGIRIGGSALGSLQKVTPAFRAIASAQADRLRVRSAVEIDDPAGGSARVTADDGLVVGHTDVEQDRLLRVGAGTTPPLVVDGAGASVTGLAAQTINAGELTVDGDVEITGGLTGPQGHLDIRGVATAQELVPAMRAGLVYDSNDRLDAYFVGNVAYTMLAGRPVLSFTGGYLSVDGYVRPIMRGYTNKGWSIAMWFKPTSTTSYGALASIYQCSQQSMDVALGSNRTVSFGYRGQDDNGQSATSTTTITDDGWHHVAGVRDTVAGKIRVYVDGALAAENTLTSTLGHSSDLPLYFGTSVGCDGSTNPFHGHLDAIRVYQRALTGDEISAYYLATKPLHD